MSCFLNLSLNSFIVTTSFSFIILSNGKYENLDNIKLAFEKYVKLLPNDGLLVVNADDENCSTLPKCTSAKIVTFGLEKQNANFIARNITFNANGFPTFDVYYNNNFYKTISLSVPGKHNVMDALACIATCHSYGIEKSIIADALKKFTGAHRRYEFVGTFHGNISVFDDYAHHPTSREKSSPYSTSKLLILMGR